MRTFLEISIENKAHDVNREELFRVTVGNETINVDYGIVVDESTFETNVWNTKGSLVIGNRTYRIKDGALIG